MSTSARPGDFAPIGVPWHHTASTSSATNPHPALNICINGRFDLAGPLCQALVDYNGVNQEMTSAQYSACVAATAAVLTRLGRDASHARGHRETSTSGKIDPSFIDPSFIDST
ncbi:hypothetical protein ACH4OY_19355 [Micromonospora rubida]|uniref:N-acetylmuramoyl-L-alanine amidase domain-containing protein n=1 Tax=Micromonospora rubida TaxID=2697657 RepID=A0ABW7SM88_9ACTN